MNIINALSFRLVRNDDDVGLEEIDFSESDCQEITINEVISIDE